MSGDLHGSDMWDDARVICQRADCSLSFAIRHSTIKRFILAISGSSGRTIVVPILVGALEATIRRAGRVREYSIEAAACRGREESRRSLFRSLPD